MDEEFLLHPLKFIYWKRYNTVICADLHIGKGAHFRKHGVALPRILNKNNFWNLSYAFDVFKPTKLLILGDMVHSTQNSEWHDFTDFLDNYPSLSRILVKGNHELYKDEVYTRLGFEVMKDLTIDNFIFTHEPLETVNESLYNLCGHIHPAIGLSGQARQHIRAACFYFGKQQGILPAFGEFTGTALVRPRQGDKVFAIIENEVIKLGR